MGKPFLWMDLEMTGLDETRDHILEVAAVVTDSEFKPLRNLQRIIFQPPSVVEGMNDWCKEHHGKSGLTAAIPKGTPLAKAEQDLLALVSTHFAKDDRVVIAGNSIGNDRRFIDKYWPEFAKRLHYRMVDVSSFKEIYRERFGIKYEKKNGHRALDDINESIAELNHYLSFVQPKATP